MSDKLKTLSCVAGTVCFVFLFVLAPMSALAAENTVWTKYDNSVPGLADSGAMNGRIPLGISGKGDDTFTFRQCVIKDGSTYKMWYTGYDTPTYRIYYATSPDGLNWAKYNNVAATNSDTISTDGRIGLGTDGTGDDAHVYSPSVIKDDSTYKMWYTGHDGVTTRIYHATSPDGLTWTKYDNSIPDASDTTSTNGRIPLGTSGAGDDKFVFRPTVVKVDSVYKMWYSGKDVAGDKSRTYHAFSTDGLTWTKYSNSVPDASNTTGTKGRIPLGTSGGDENNVRMPQVVKVGSFYKMWYVGQNVTTPKNRIYYAFSTDELTWTKCTNSIPDDSDTTSTLGRVPVGESGGDTTAVYAPCVIKEGLIQEGYKYKMWYAGGDGTSYRIYLATCQQPPMAGTIFYSW